jgi:hypothetical protein
MTLDRPGEIVETEPTYICHCEFKKPKNAVDYAFVFQYRRRRWLEVAGHMEAESDSEEDPGYYIRETRSGKKPPESKDRPDDGSTRSRAISIESDTSSEDEWQDRREASIPREVKVSTLAFHQQKSTNSFSLTYREKSKRRRQPSNTSPLIHSTRSTKAVLKANLTFLTLLSKVTTIIVLRLTSITTLILLHASSRYHHLELTQPLPQYHPTLQ